MKADFDILVDSPLIETKLHIENRRIVKELFNQIRK